MKSQVILPSPPNQYSQNDQAQMRRAISAEDLRNVKVDDIATAAQRGVVKADGVGITVDADGTIHVANYKEATWTPADASGATLALTVAAAVYTQIGNLVYLYFDITYPSTANSATALIGGLPVAVPASRSAPNAVFVSSGITNGPLAASPLASSSTMQLILLGTGGTPTNANLSLKRIAGYAIYRAN